MLGAEAGGTSVSAEFGEQRSRFPDTEPCNRRGPVDDEQDVIDPKPANRPMHERPAPPPTAKLRNAAQSEVNRLLDALAPERATARRPTTMGDVDRHRTPRGCILQAPAGAVSVSWFADSAQGNELGEVQVVAWSGKVSRPGSSATRSEGAEVIEQLTLRPVERAEAGLAWRAEDGTMYTTESLAAHCLELLEQRTEDGGTAPDDEEEGGGHRLS